jgi:hypothetical protein
MLVEVKWEINDVAADLIATLAAVFLVLKRVTL